MTLTKARTLALSEEGRAPGDAHRGFTTTGWPGVIWELSTSAVHCIPLESQHFPQWDDTTEMGFMRFGRNHLSSIKSCPNRTYPQYQTQPQNYNLISDLIFCWYSITNTKQYFLKPDNFLGLISHCPKKTPPYYMPVGLYCYHNWICALESAALIPIWSLKILPFCTPSLLRAFF